MNNLNKVDIEYYNYNQPPQKEDLIGQMLPFEIFEKVLFYLNNNDLQRASLVNRFWNMAAIDTAKHDKKVSEIKDFANFLGKNLKKESHGNQRKKLFDVGGDTKILDSTNLKQVKSSINKYIETILNALKDLSKEDLKNLEEVSKNEPKPGFLENVFDLARIYKKIDEAGQIPDDYIRGNALYNISKALTKKGSIYKAIKVAYTIPDDSTRGCVLYDISQALTKKGSIDKAIEVANTIPDDSTRGYALYDISQALTQRGSIDKAIEVANMIPNDSKRDDALKYISKALTRIGNIDKAIEVAYMITSKHSAW